MAHARDDRVAVAVSIGPEKKPGLTPLACVRKTVRCYCINVDDRASAAVSPQFGCVTMKCCCSPDSPAPLEQP